MCGYVLVKISGIGPRRGPQLVEVTDIGHLKYRNLELQEKAN